MEISFEQAVYLFAQKHRKQQYNRIATAGIRRDAAYDEWLEENLDKFASGDEELKFANWKDKSGHRIREAENIDDVEKAWDEYNKERQDGGPGSGNFGHKGVKGQIGGSAPTEKRPPNAAEKRSLIRFTGNNATISEQDAENIENAIEASKGLDPDLEYSRGISITKSELDDLLQKGIYKPDRLTSWSADESVADWFAREGNAWDEDKYPVVLKYRGTKNLDKGMEISAFSQVPDEDEFVFSKSIRMKIAKDEVSGYDPNDDSPTGTVYINLYDDDRADGGPGSGNFGHEGRPGEVGGSGPAEYAGLSEEGRDIIKEHIRNPYHFGSSDEQKSANRQKLIRALSDIGVKVDYDKEEDTYSMISTNMSYEENRAIGAALNQGRFYRTVDREEYCRKCKEDGKVPRLHETPDTFPDGWLISKSGKTMTDGTPVYKALSKEGVLSDKELVDFSGLDREVSPEGAEKARKATAEAIDKMSNAERNALHNYTKQWSGENYQAVNGYLVTGEGDERAKKAAENVTSALDHPIGVDCITMRGDNGVYGTGKDEAITKLVNKVAKGDFSAAKKLQDMLTGQTITNKAAMSTSPNDTTSGYGQRPVQYVFKTPKDAKAVDISQLSSFGGGRSEVEKKLAATGLFGAVEHESEVLFKPGTRYKIDEVKFSAEFDRKGKRTGQVFIIATILTGNEDSRNDGGPGSGNHGHKGVPGQIGGSAPGNGSREVREGKDLSKTITGVVPISYVLKKQGYDGLPKVVGQKEFDKAVKESKFIAQRSYTASSKEVLDAYRNQLWNGDFYAECSVGGAQYGQGMYCASDYDGNLTDGIREEMDHYNRLGDKRYGREMSDEERCEKSIEYLKKWKEVEFTDDLEEYVRAQFSGDLARYSEAEKKVTPKQKAFANVAEEEIGMYEDAPEYIETLTLDPSAKVISYDDIRSIQYGNGTDACRKYERDFVDPFIQEAIEKHGLSEEEITFIKDRLRVLTDDEEESLKPEAVKWYTSLEQSERDKVGKKLINIVVPIRETLYAQERINRQLDTGAFAALLGYDAIKADAHGKSGSYTVILNRTKTIFLDDSIHEDAKDDHSITFQFGDDGVLYAIKDRKVIGWVRALEASNRGGNEDSRTDDKEPKDWITINGTHVPIDESGEITGKVAEKIKGTSTNKSEPKDNLLKDLHPDVEYPERVEYWKEQIKKGNHRPVLVDKKDPTRVIDGNHTLAAYQELGMEPEVYAMDRIEFLNGAGEADDTVEYIRNAIKEGKAEKIGGGKPTTGQKTVGDKMKPANTDYEYDDGDDQDTWTNKNVKKLMPIYKKGGSEAIDSEFRKYRMERTTQNVQQISKDDADATVYDHVSQSVFDGWFRNADSSYKPKLVDAMLSSKEMRTAGLSLAYENYKNCTESPMPFDEFLTTPITMYRGGHGQKHTKDDVFSAYTFDRKTAEHFAGSDGKITETKIRPIDTYGSMRAVGEAET